MYQVQLSSEELDIILSSINQAQARLRGMKLRQVLLPMQYCARLAWEALYEARQILRNLQKKSRGDSYPEKSSMVCLTLSELNAITPSIEQVMAHLQVIETNTDLSAMQAAVQTCLQQLNSVTAILTQTILALPK